MPSTVHWSDTPVVALEQSRSSSKPALSAIVVIPDSYDTVRNLMHALSTQTARELMEIVIVAPSVDAVTSGITDLDVFGDWRIVELGVMRSVAHAKRAGIRCATAPVVVMTEDHSLPEPDWAHSLIEAHRDGWAAVGPAVENGNPQSLISWADFVIAYSQWFNPRAAGEVDDLPGHNSSYKRDLLLEYQDRLEEMLDAETVLHQDLREHGHRLYLEPAAKTLHNNFTQPLPWILYLSYSARVFAAQRVCSWPLRRRVAYSAGACLIPLVRLKRIVPEIRRSRPDLLPRVLAPLLFALAVDAVGQWVGYTFGAGRASEKLTRLEFHRNGASVVAVPPARREAG